MSGEKSLRILLVGAASVLIGLVVLGFTGSVFAPGDAVTIVRPQLGLLLMIFAAVLWLTKARRTALIALIAATMALGSVASGFFMSGTDCPGECLKLYQKNLLSTAWPRYPLAADIIASGAEIVTLQEVSDHNREHMENLFAHFPFAVICKFRPEQDVAVLTSLTAVDGSAFCLEDAGMAGIQVLAPDGRLIWLVSVHLEWPFPFDQFRQSRLVAKRITELEGPVLIAGDFNMVPWGASVRRIGNAAGNRHLGGFRNTFDWGSWVLPLPLDTVLVPQGAIGMFELRPYMGSDHLGVLARISLR